MWGKVLIITIIIYLTFCSPKEHCVCGVKIPEGGGVCEWCGEYNHRMIIRREREFKRIEEEKSEGNSYDTFL